MSETGLGVIALVAEQRILEAQERGDFMNLPGQGRPLRLEDDSAVPEDLRMAYRILRNAGFLPPELEERKQITSLVEMLEQCVDAQERVRQMQKVRFLLTQLRLRRNRPVHLEENDPYYQQLVERISLVARKHGLDENCGKS